MSSKVVLFKNFASLYHQQSTCVDVQQISRKLKLQINTEPIRSCLEIHYLANVSLAAKEKQKPRQNVKT